MSKRSLATAAAVIGLLAAAAPAHAGTFVGNPDRHALTFSGDAYVNEMGFSSLPDATKITKAR